MLPIIGRTEQGNPAVRVSVTFEGWHDAGIYALADVRGKGEDLVVVTLHLGQQRPLRYLGANWGLFRPYRGQLVRVAEEDELDTCVLAELSNVVEQLLPDHRPFVDEYQLHPFQLVLLSVDQLTLFPTVTEPQAQQRVDRPDADTGPRSNPLGHTVQVTARLVGRGCQSNLNPLTVKFPSCEAGHC